jgi:septum formation protein
LTLILASGSPRRRELLSRITREFRVVHSGVPEETGGTAEERVLRAATAKARSVRAGGEAVVIAADTVVLLDGDVLGKPVSRDEAERMLWRLSGREHVVITGLCVRVAATGAERTACERTVVRFRDLERWEIDSYLDAGEYRDKAGAYAIQGRAAAFVDRICGDYNNVVGLPLCRLVLLLREVGVRV